MKNTEPHIDKYSTITNTNAHPTHVGLLQLIYICKLPPAYMMEKYLYVDEIELIIPGDNLLVPH